MVNYFSEFFHLANLCKELVDGILDRLCLAGLVSRHLRIQRNFRDKNEAGLIRNLFGALFN